MRYIFDTNALIEAGNAVSLPNGGRAAIPLVVLQELLFQLGRADRVRPARAVFRAIDRDGYDLLPGFEDSVFCSVGLAPRFWPSEQGFWRMVISEARREDWPRVSAWWETRWKKGLTGMAPGVFAMMKANGGEFAEVADQRNVELRAIRQEEVERRRTEGVTDREIRRSLRLRQEELIKNGTMTEIGALAGIPVAQDVMDALIDEPGNDAAPGASMALGNYLSLHQNGDLDFAVTILTALRMRWVDSQQAPDRNDPFDLMLLCSVDADAGSVLVTSERRWHTLARECGLSDRVIRMQDIPA